MKKTSAYQFDNTLNLPFSAEMYSRMKFGCVESSIKCANALADKVINEFTKNGIPKNIVASPSPYQEIPKSSNHIFDHFIKRMNRFLFDNNHLPIKTTRIRSCHVYTVDYGKLEVSERETLIGKDSWTFNKDLLNNSYFFILDDLRMTGTLEKTVIRQINEQKINEICNEIHFIYFAENIGKEVPDNFENILNFNSITSIKDLISIINTGQFKWNMRNLKYVLESSTDEIDYFLQNYNHEDFLDIIINLLSTI